MDEQLIPLLGAFQEKRILVIGDLMLDLYMRGDVRRISPEAPVPILHVRKERDVRSQVVVDMCVPISARWVRTSRSAL